MAQTLERARATGGMMERRPPAEEMEGETRTLIKEVGKTRVGWKEWFNNFMSSRRALDNRNYNALWNAAKHELDQQGDLAIGRMYGILRPWKRRLYLQAMKEVMARKSTDLQRYVKAEMAERAQGLRGLAKEVRGSKGIKMNSKHRVQVLESLNRLKVSNTVRVDPQTKKIWTEAIAKEGTIADTLLKLGVVEDPYEMDLLLNANRSGSKALITIVRTASQLDSDEDTRQKFIKDLYNVRSGTARYSQAQKAITNSDRNIDPVPVRLRKIAQDPSVFDRTLRISPDGGAPETAKVTYCANGMITAHSASGTDFVISVRSGKYTGRDASGREFEGRLNDRNFLAA